MKESLSCLLRNRKYFNYVIQSFDAIMSEQASTKNEKCY